MLMTKLLQHQHQYITTHMNCKLLFRMPSHAYMHLFIVIPTPHHFHVKAYMAMSVHINASYADRTVVAVDHQMTALHNVWWTRSVKMP